MGLMRFQAGHPKTGTPGPTPPLKKAAGGGLAVTYMYLHPPRGVGAKSKTSLYPR